VVQDISVNKRLPGEIYVAHDSGNAQVLRVDRDGQCVRARVRPFDTNDPDDKGWTAVEYGSHPRHVYIATGSSIRRHALEVSSTQLLFHVRDWKLSSADSHIRSMSQSELNPFWLNVATRNHFCICDQRFLRAPLASWLLLTAPGPSQFQSSLACGDTNFIFTVVSTPAAYISCLRFRGRDLQQSDHHESVFSASPFLSAGPPFCNLLQAADPVGISLVPLGDAPAEDKQIAALCADATGGLKMQRFQLGGQSRENRSPEPFQRETPHVLPPVDLPKIPTSVSEDVEQAIQMGRISGHSLEELNHDDLLDDFTSIPRTQAESEEFKVVHKGHAPTFEEVHSASTQHLPGVQVSSADTVVLCRDSFPQPPKTTSKKGKPVEPSKHRAKRRAADDADKTTDKVARLLELSDKAWRESEDT